MGQQRSHSRPRGRRLTDENGRAFQQRKAWTFGQYFCTSGCKARH